MAKLEGQRREVATAENQRRDADAKLIVSILGWRMDC